MSNPDTLQKTASNKVASPAPSAAAAAAAAAASSPGQAGTPPPKQSFNYAAAASSAKAQAGKSTKLNKDSSTAASIHASPPAANTVPRQSQSMSTAGSPSLNHGATSRDGQTGNGTGDAASLIEGTKANGTGRGASPVSMAKRSIAASSNAGINFGAPHDNDSTLSSSPAGPAHLASNAPTKFGSVEADAKVNKEKVAARSLDLNKLFQGTPQTPSKSTSAAQNGSLGPESAGASSLTPRTPSTATGSSLRGSAAAQRPFEPQRSPSAQPFHPMNAQSGAWPPQQQQPRSPHLGHQSNMQPMPPMGAPPHWQGQQMVSVLWSDGKGGNLTDQMFYQYYPNMYHQPYGYPGMPQQQQQHPSHHMSQQWNATQPGYDGTQGQPRSPRHMPASPMGAHPGTPQQSNGSLQPATPSTSATPGLSSPAASQRSIPHTPTTNPSSLASPQPGHQFGMGQPSNRGLYHGTAASAYAHSPSQSFAGAMNPMSPSARQFEPAQKRMSSAIKIVNPETHAAIDLKAAAAAREASSPKTAPRTPTVATPSPLPVPAKAAASVAPATPTLTPAATAASNAAKIDTTESFMARVKAAAAESKKAKAEAAANVEREAAEKKAKEEAEIKAKEAEEERIKKVKADEEAAKQREIEEKAAAERKAAEEAAAKAEADKKEQEAKAEAEAQEQAAREAAEAKAAAEASRRAEEERERAEAEAKAVEAAEAEAKEKAATDGEKKPGVPAPIDTSITVTEAKLDAEEEVVEGGQKKEAPTTPFRNSAAEVERLAREASSVPSTPLDGNTPRLPPTPRTPGTPGFANLPAKPTALSSMNSASNGLKLDSEALEKKKRPVPSQLDLTAAQTKAAATGAGGEKIPMSAASAALGSARFIEDIKKVSYPAKINSPKPELNESAEPGKFRYDRDFLLQFMGVYKEKPSDLPPLADIGMDSSQAAGGRGPPGRRASGMGPPAAPGRGGSQMGLGLGGFGAKAGNMGQFQHAPKTSEERFAQSNAKGAVGAFGSSGPMGSFNAGARSQPLSRTGSGSNAIPSRDVMGSGMPSGGRTQSRRGRERRDAGGSRNQVNPPERGGPTIPMDQVVPLQASEKRWMGGRGAQKPADGPEMVTRKVKALLNKLTMEKFDSISSQILDWANKSVNEKDGQTLRLVIALIFEKATDEAAWSEMYALLCRKILEELNPEIQDENLKTNDNRPVSGGHLFRKYLLNRCQEDFERGWAQRDSTAAAAKSKEAEDAAKKAENDKAEEEAKEAAARGDKQESAPKDTELLSEEYYEAQKAKRRGLGLVRFIGELFKFAMLTEKIMHICIQRLLSNAQDPEEEEIESLCKLMTTVGKLLATGKAANYMTIYFTRIQEIMSNGAMNSRMKFMLQDVIDLRANDWTPRHDNSAPKTIAQIHEDAAKQKAQADADAYARQSRGNLGGAMSRGGSRRGQPRDQYGPDGFITVGNQPAPAQTKAGNLSGFGKGFDRSAASTRPLSVGPQSVFAKKNQKSDDGSNPPSRTASSQNIFSLLSSTTEGGAGESPTQAEDPASGRPKLNLAKRTKPLPSQEGGEDDKKEEDEGEVDKDDAEEEEMSDEQAAKKIDNDIKEFLEIKDIDEGVDALEALPAKRRGEFVGKIVEIALNKKEDDVDLVGRLFEAAREKSLLDDDMVHTGLKEQVEMLDDLAIDVPAAFKYMAMIIVSSGLPNEKIEAMAETIEGEGAKDRFMDKVKEQQA